jgi:hypothetical protein
LNAALAALGRGNTATACARIQDFINQCRAQQGNKLTVAAADSLIADAVEIQGLIGCP